MITDHEKRCRDELFRLMRENQDLPVVPFVDGEIVGDEFGTWMGSWGPSRIDEYLIPPQSYEQVIFKSYDDVFGTLEKCISPEDVDALPWSENECRPIYDALPWTKAIIVNIEMPKGWKL